MGVDVNLYAEGDFTLEQLYDANLLLLARSSLPDPEYHDGHALHVDPETPRRAELYTLARYYGPGYERGDWPAIYGAIKLMKAAFPTCRIYYGTDSVDDGDECTGEFLLAMWNHFVGPHGHDYYARRSEA